VNGAAQLEAAADQLEFPLIVKPNVGGSGALVRRLIRPLVLASGLYNFFAAMFVAVYTLFMVRDLGLDPATIGGIIACGGLGGVLGGLAAEPLAERVGAGRAIVLSAMLLGLMHLAAPLAAGPPALAAPLLAGAGLLAQLGLGVMVVNRTGLVQQLVPAYALGRVAASQQVIGLAAVPVGAAFGGLIGEGPGLRVAVAIGVLGTVAATASLLRSPLWTASNLAEWLPVREPPLLGSSEGVPRFSVGSTPANTLARASSAAASRTT